METEKTTTSATEGAPMKQHHYTSRNAANRARRAMKEKDTLEVQPDGNGKFVIVPAPNKTRANELKRAKAEGKAKRKAAVTKRARAEGEVLGKRAQLQADAEAGKLPKAPDFSAKTHERFRPKLDELKALVKAGDVKALKAYPINPISSSPKALDRYRNLAVIALQAQAKEARS